MKNNEKVLVKSLAVSFLMGFLLGLIDGLPVLSAAFFSDSVLGWVLLAFGAGTMFLLIGVFLGVVLLLFKDKGLELEVVSVVISFWLSFYFLLNYVDQRALIYTEGHWVLSSVKIIETAGGLVLALLMGVLVSKGLRGIVSLGENFLKGVLIAWLVLLLVVGGLVIWGPGKKRVRVGKDNVGEGKSVILVTVDTLRGDVVDKGWMEETKNFFEDGWVRRVYAPSSWTIPSFASMWSGKVPTEIGAVKSIEEVHGKDDERVFVPDSVETLAERLQSEGYVTQAFANNFLLNEERGYGQGFEGFYNREDVRGWHWVGANQKVSMVKLWHRVPVLRKAVKGWYGRVVGETYQPWSRDEAELIVDEGIEWLETRENKEGVFLWMHLVDPHSPYKYHQEWGVKTNVEPRDILSLEHIENEKKMRLREVDKQAVFELYEGEVKYTDKQLGVFWDYLTESGWSDEAVVIFTSDHGEEFWEHGNLGHVRSYYEETVNVPLMVKGVGLEEPEGELSLVDLKGTVLEMVSIKDDDLKSWLDEGYEDETVWLDGDGWGPIRKGMREDYWKYIEDIDGNRELYNLLSDGKEQINLAESFSYISDPLSVKLRDFFEEKEKELIKADENFESGVFVGY